MIRYLKETEKEKAAPLYRQAFFEDSESFVQYYFSHRIRNNRILVDEEDGTICAMLHLNPYRLAIRDGREEIDYIVAVATDKKFRRQGRMARLLHRAFLDMYRLRRPFVYLLPANPAYYTPFDFVYISGKEETSRREGEEFTEKRFTSEDTKSLISFLQESLAGQKEIYALRDAAYTEDLFAQLSAEEGEICLFLDGQGRIVGEKIIWGEKREEREYILHPDFGTTKETDKPYMMGRIIHLPSFLMKIGLKKDVSPESQSIIIFVSDDVIGENTGYFRWELTKKGSSLISVNEEEARREGFYRFSVGELTNLLFGCKNGSHPYPEEPVFSQIDVYYHVFLNEVV